MEEAKPNKLSFCSARASHKIRARRPNGASTKHVHDVRRKKYKPEKVSNKERNNNVELILLNVGQTSFPIMSVHLTYYLLHRLAFASFAHVTNQTISFIPTIGGAGGGNAETCTRSPRGWNTKCGCVMTRMQFRV